MRPSRHKRSPAWRIRAIHAATAFRNRWQGSHDQDARRTGKRIHPGRRTMDRRSCRVVPPIRRDRQAHNPAERDHRFKSYPRYHFQGVSGNGNPLFFGSIPTFLCFHPSPVTTGDRCQPRDVWRTHRRTHSCEATSPTSAAKSALVTTSAIDPCALAHAARSD